MSADRSAPAVNGQIKPVGSRDNPLVQRIYKLARDGQAYRKLGQAWIEGEHLCSALLARGLQPAQAVIAESAWQQPALAALAVQASSVALLPDKLFAEISALPSPAGLGFVHDLPPAAALEPGVASVVLDRLQDAGNVGSILRSASALGVRQVLALRGTAGLWSPKVLRAGMGAQFGLVLHENLDAGDWAAWGGTLGGAWVATSSHATQTLNEVALPRICTWVFGHEGQGVSEALMQHCALTVRIPQPGGEESLNVAAAAAICLYESLRQR